MTPTLLRKHALRINRCSTLQKIHEGKWADEAAAAGLASDRTFVLHLFSEAEVTAAWDLLLPHVRAGAVKTAFVGKLALIVQFLA